MKKLLLLAAAAAVSTGAFAADYTVASPYADASVTEGKTCIFDIVLANDGVIEGLQKAGQKVNDWRVNDATNFFYIWDNTYSGVPTTYPGIGYSDLVPGESYVDLAVGSVGWSGAGYNVASVNTKHWTSETRVHIAARTDATSPASVAFVIADGTGSSPAKVALGSNFIDGASTYPSVGPQITDEWVAIDMSFADLQKEYPTFVWDNVDAWNGNIVSILGGGVTGQTFCLDAIYFYTPENEDPGVGEEPEYPYMAATPYASASVTEGKVTIFDVLVANDQLIGGLTNDGQTVNDWRVNEVDRFFYLWEGTFAAGPETSSGVGYDGLFPESYVSVNVVGGPGWSGAGFVPNGVDTEHWNDNTRLHIAARTNGTAPASVGFTVIGQNGNDARLALGSNFIDGSTVFKSVGPRIGDEWKAIDISFAELKELNPNFQYSPTSSWNDNMLTFLGGGEGGQNICLDAVYFYTLTDNISGVDNMTVAAEGETQVYDLSGRLVLSGRNLNLNDLNNGIYVVKSGKDVKKIIK